MATGRPRRAYPGVSYLQSQQRQGGVPLMGPQQTQAYGPGVPTQQQQPYGPQQSQQSYGIIQQPGQSTTAGSPSQPYPSPQGPVPYGPGVQDTYQQPQMQQQQQQPSVTQYPYYNHAAIAPASDQQQQQQLVNGMASMGLTGQAPSGPPPFNLHSGPPPVYDMFETAYPNVPLSYSISESIMANADSRYKRSTLNAIPNSATLFNKARVPFGVLMTPFRNQLPSEPPVPLIAAPYITRCRRCRTYVNPFIVFVDQGTRWKCNMCSLTNDVPSYFDWDPQTNSRVDRKRRPELNFGIVDYVAAQEYMVRPPQPVIFLFVIDVTYAAVQSGMVHVAAGTILNTLDQIPNDDDRTKVGFITVDRCLHFYNLSAELNEPRMLVIGDLEDEIALPLPSDLIVSLSESKEKIREFLGKLPNMFLDTHETQNNFSAALKCAQKILGAIGGKIIALQVSLPNAGEGSLKDRDDPKLQGTPKAHALLQPATNFYKTFAVSCSPAQIGIDLFLFGPSYADVATLSGATRYTGGSLFYYPNFAGSRREDAEKFSMELSHLLSRPIGLEAVLRIRASRGIKMTAFHGNFFLRSTDLLSLPTVAPDHCYAVEMSVTENITSSIACFQTALLHSSSTGERRIRVLTLAVPLTSHLNEVYAGVDHIALSTLMAKKGIDRALTTSMDEARKAIEYKLQEIMAVYKSICGASVPAGSLAFPQNMKLLPLIILGLLKNPTLRDSASIPSDLRSYLMAQMYVLPPEYVAISLYPRFWCISTLLENSQIGDVMENGDVVFPEQLTGSSEHFQREGAYLLDNGLDLFLWLGKNVSPEFCQSVFGQPGYQHMISGKISIPTLENQVSQRFMNIINKIRETRRYVNSSFPQIYLVLEEGDPSMKMWVLSHLIQDRFDNVMSYHQWLSTLREDVGKMSL